MAKYLRAILYSILSRAADPDPYDLYVFRPPEPGSGSISQMYRYSTDVDLDPSIIKRK